MKTIPITLTIQQNAYESVVPVYGPPVGTGISIGTGISVGTVIGATGRNPLPILYYTYAIRENDIIPACFSTNTYSLGYSNRLAVQIYDGPNIGCSPRLRDLSNRCGFSDGGNRFGQRGVYNACGTFSWRFRRWSSRTRNAYGSTHTPTPGRTWKQCGITKGALKEEMWGCQVTWTPNACAKIVQKVPLTAGCDYRGFQTSYSSTTHPDGWAVSIVV